MVEGKRKRKEKGGFKTKKEAQEGLRIALNKYANIFLYNRKKL
ncbi:Arm DNA-binding domain-containing protein [Clostridium subterminale]